MAPPPLGRAPLPRGHLVYPPTPFSCMILILVSKNSLYNLPKVLTTVPRKNPLFSFRAIFLTDLEHHDVSKTRREIAMQLIISQTQRHTGMWNITVGPRRQKKSMIQRERRRRVQTKMKPHYLNLGTCMWSLKSQASLIGQRSQRSSLSLFISCRKTNRNYVKGY